MLNFWQTLSDCLTGLVISVDWLQPRMLLQHQFLRQLTALTAMTFSVDQATYVEEDNEMEIAVWQQGDVVHLPKLKQLHVSSYWGRHLVLECPQLTSLSMLNCAPVGPVSLQAPLQQLCATCPDGFVIHPGFPLSNFLDMVSLSIECQYEGEGQLYQTLPLMKRLTMLNLRVKQGRLLQSLPQSLSEVDLEFVGREAWDDAVVPVVQQLPELRVLRFEFCLGPSNLARLSSNLRPFMLQQKLRILELGEWQAWTPDTLRALGQFEAELLRSGSRIELKY